MNSLILDCHIHVLTPDQAPDPSLLLRDMKKAGVSGGVIIGLPPASFRHLTRQVPFADRLRNLLDWARSTDLFPLFWLDPTESDAAAQVDRCMAAGVKGFKVICDRFYPGDDRALRTFKHIAATGKPILFHSGILWDGQVSSKYNRPVEFEALLDVPGLRFMLAHISWPWCDELVAVFGKFINARSLRKDLNIEMFVDLTPGTPPIYRDEALKRLFGSGYDVSRNVCYGTDCMVKGYDISWTRSWIERDSSTLERIGVPAETIQNVFAENLKRFLGLA